MAGGSSDCAAITIVALSLGFDLGVTNGLTVLISFFGFVDSACLYLAFLPPRRYAERLRRRSEAVGA